MLYTIGMVLTWIAALGIIYVGVMYLLRNEANAAGFGLPVLPAPEARAWWQLKGVRDIASGLVLIPLVFVEPDAVPWVVLVEAVAGLHRDRHAVRFGRGDRRRQVLREEAALPRQCANPHGRAARPRVRGRARCSATWRTP